ncbi:VanW family protein [Deinococcus pimensis]|uniref:VanW family protein n=1 Tax=Deinococcus pimensis TaxID=309888 RepID=UPI000485FF66|nr:VanW family protein [Deinococcus pimensis]
MHRLLLTILAAGIIPGAAGAAERTYPSLTLTLTTSEPRIVSGRLRDEGVVKRFTLDGRLVARSRRLGRLSTELGPSLDHVVRLVEKRTPREAYWRNENGHWVARQQTGWTVDRARTKANILRAVLSGKNEAELAVNLTEPRRSVRDWAKAGILFHVASGTSSYRGSPPFREKNILVAASKLEESYVKPGEVLSFNGAVGPVDAKHGFVKGYVIAGGTLEKEDGGGLCQVSATLFRAAFSGGFPIEERHEHSHRVKYYDPVGYEATVYAPDKDFRFRNDTKAPLFIQASWDRARQTLRFDLFGARPARRVSVHGPIVTDFEPAAKPTYTADTRVAKGGRRLLDTPMQGMTSVIYRRVTNLASGKTRTDRVKSVYRPWGAVYGVNPSDPRLRDGR